MTTIPRPPAESASAEKGRNALPWISWTCLALAGSVALYPLSCTWTFFSNYAFGWWVPLLALVLFWERWPRRPAPSPSSRLPNLGLFILGWAGLFFCLRLALEVSMIARPLVWGGTLLYVAALLYWLWVYGGEAWARHFAFPACFLLLSVPWPLQLENPIVQGLAPFNAWLVANILVDFGIFAQATGQVIILPNCVLGVREACSGLRSLQAALMIAFLIGELYRFSWPRRIQIVFLAVGLALLGNVLRTLFLALTAANYGVAVMSRWHDTAGGFILVFTSVTTFLVSHFLFRSETPSLSPRRLTPSGNSRTRGSQAQSFALAILLSVLLIEGATQAWFAWRERQVAPYPLWTFSPPSAPEVSDVEIDEETRDILKYDQGRQVEWKDENGWAWSVYWFFYQQKPWAVSAFTNHNPDKCFPAAGFQMVKDYPPFRVALHGYDFEIYPKQFEQGGVETFVFWMVYANRPNFPLEEAVNPPDDGALAKIRFYLSSVWNGRRGSTSETESLEVIITGPSRIEDAKEAYLVQLQKIITPAVNSPTGSKPTSGI